MKTLIVLVAALAMVVTTTVKAAPNPYWTKKDDAVYKKILKYESAKPRLKGNVKKLAKLQKKIDKYEAMLSGPVWPKEKVEESALVWARSNSEGMTLSAVEFNLGQRIYPDGRTAEVSFSKLVATGGRMKNGQPRTRYIDSSKIVFELDADNVVTECNIWQ